MKKVRVVIIRDYVNTLTKFSNFLDEDLPIGEISDAIPMKLSLWHRHKFPTRPSSTTMLVFLL